MRHDKRQRRIRIVAVVTIVALILGTTGGVLLNAILYGPGLGARGSRPW